MNYKKNDTYIQEENVFKFGPQFWSSRLEKYFDREGFFLKLLIKDEQ